MPDLKKVPLGLNSTDMDLNVLLLVPDNYCLFYRVYLCKSVFLISQVKLADRRSARSHFFPWTQFKARNEILFIKNNSQEEEKIKL